MLAWSFGRYCDNVAWSDFTFVTSSSNDVSFGVFLVKEFTVSMNYGENATTSESAGDGLSMNLQYAKPSWRQVVLYCIRVIDFRSCLRYCQQVEIMIPSCRLSESPFCWFFPHWYTRNWVMSACQHWCTRSCVMSAVQGWIQSQPISATKVTVCAIVDRTIVRWIVAQLTQPDQWWIQGRATGLTFSWCNHFCVLDLLLFLLRGLWCNVYTRMHTHTHTHNTHIYIYIYIYISRFKYAAFSSLCT